MSTHSPHVPVSGYDWLHRQRSLLAAGLLTYRAAQTGQSTAQLARIDRALATG